MDVAEIYNPPRVTRAAQVLTKLGITPGFALDITVDDETGEPWDLSKPEKQDKAISLTIDTEPDLVVGSPPCIDFSPWQRLNKAVSREPEKYDERKKAAVKHLECVCKVYKIQHCDGRLFLYEHPQQASS